MPADQLNDIIRQLKEKVEMLTQLSNEMRNANKTRLVSDIQADINAVLNDMSSLHEKASKLTRLNN